MSIWSRERHCLLRLNAIPARMKHPVLRLELEDEIAQFIVDYPRMTAHDSTLPGGRQCFLDLPTHFILLGIDEIPSTSQGL